ncbi:hypothetical protein MTQ10_05280 [Streptomyces sp. XM83C]|jgi:hypothetical protein|uniref:DUF8017 domain-containing protein n=1 Tax=Streptomyces thermocoprophilus TaxID=78356 RepID=A0ABV5VLP9_9ACTN|nr:hypothetical protein [Streptomyces sp. XM83C]MCK1819035.1 hypothetical protein [Streptomyces sp. XM83C]
MWPGQQQPPGGDQNPHGQNNPYQQPGYQQPNPYQQPGYQQPTHQQPNPYAQTPQTPQWQAPTVVNGPQPPQGGGNRTKVVAIVAATAVVVAAGVTGFLVLGGDKDDNAKGDDGKGTKVSQSASPSTQPSATSSEEENPRSAETEKPTVPGWKVVINPKWGIAYDVPADWQVNSPTLSKGFEEDNADDLKPIIVMSGTAEYKSKWCTSDDDRDGRTENTPLAVVGSKGASGAKNTDEIAINTPAWWVYGGYTQPDKKTISWSPKATPFTTASGIKGSYDWAKSTNSPQKGKGKCNTDGKALTFGFQNSKGDYVSFNFYGATGVTGEVSEATVLQILKTVRLHGTPQQS